MLKISSVKVLRHKLSWALLVVLSCGLTLSAQPNVKSRRGAAEQKTAGYFESIRKSPPKQLAFLLKMPKGGDLNIRCYSLGATVILEIVDTGTGIQQGLDPFALFKTTKADGTGLGLPIVEQIVLAHNGTIEYTSEPGRGTTFKIILRRQFR